MCCGCSVISESTSSTCSTRVKSREFSSFRVSRCLISVKILRRESSKQYQLSDWRQRPLKGLENVCSGGYVSSLYIAMTLRNELIDSSTLERFRAEFTCGDVET